MRYQFLISILFQISYEFSYVRVDNFEISYSITYESSCHVEIDRFLFKLQSSIENCVKACSSRQHCQALNFRKGINVCELFSTSESGQLAGGNCLHVEKDDINVIQTPCKNGCKYGEVCETTDSGIGTCVIKECLNVTVPDHGTILGNQREIGKKIRYKCDKGYKEKNVTSATVAECLSTGNWSANAECHKINYTWTTWMDWSSCSLSCDSGTRARSRICSIASENLSEELCKEGNKSFEEESCNKQNCPSPTIGNNCTDDADCIETEGTCIEGKCFCNRLYRYNTTTSNCTKVCQSMSKEFEMVDNKYIAGFKIGADVRKENIEGCESACRDNTECLSFDVWQESGDFLCSMGSVTYEMIKDANLTLSNSAALNLYTRKCNL